MKKFRIRRVNRDISLIVVHATRTPSVVKTPEELEEYLEHNASDFSDYHYVIMFDGNIYVKRDIATPGYHAPGYNAESVGVAYLGGMKPDGLPADTRTPEQKGALLGVVSCLKAIWPEAEIRGAYNYTGSDSPFFNVEKEYQDIKSINIKH